MHSAQMPDSAGTFAPADDELYHCYACEQKTAKCESWDSSCGGYTDYRYICTDPKCGKVRWVDGADS